MEDITNKELKELLINLTESLKENTEINRELLELLKLNNKETEDIHKFFEVELSPQQQWKDFGLNVLANVIGNSVASPQLINLR